MISENNPELFEFLRAKLNLSDGAVVKEEPVLKNASTNLRVDMVIEDDTIGIFTSSKPTFPA